MRTSDEGAEDATGGRKRCLTRDVLHGVVQHCRSRWMIGFEQVHRLLVQQNFFFNQTFFV